MAILCACLAAKPAPTSTPPAHNGETVSMFKYMADQPSAIMPKLKPASAGTTARCITSSIACCTTRRPESPAEHGIIGLQDHRWHLQVGQERPRSGALARMQASDFDLHGVRLDSIRATRSSITTRIRTTTRSARASAGCVLGSISTSWAFVNHDDVSGLLRDRRFGRQITHLRSREAHGLGADPG